MNAPITATELQEILRLHSLWTQGKPDGKRADLRRADLSGAYLREANLREANLQEANLREANLWGADLQRANLWEADLRGADLQRANLREANLRGADLQRANLWGADLRGADLRGADLQRANLQEANLILIGQDIRGYLFWAVRNNDGIVVIRAGCHEFVGISAAKNHWTNRHEDDAVLHEDCLSLVDRCERMAKVRGWKLEIETVAI